MKPCRWKGGINIVIKSDDHIMVGDHEDIKKDLKQEHS
jgi:hypothetical protein